MKIKNTVIALMICCLCGSVTYGQNRKGGGFSFGVKGGMNLSQLSMGNFLTTRYDANGNPFLKYDGQVGSR